MPTELGSAHGTIVIDAQLDQAAAQINAFSQKTEQQFARISQSTSKAESSFAALAGVGRSLAGAFGIGFGAQAVAQLARAAFAADEVAVAYNRQMVAAVSLAGSQGELNALLETYDQATGGAVDQATALAGVTNLMAQGFADSTDELETFLTGVRGAAIAMGRPQEFIIERAQFEMLNQTGQRLNEIGLSMEEVRARAADLREENQQLTKEQAYQQAVMDSLNEKYGELSKSSEGAATGVERVRAAWADLRLEVAQEFHPGFDQLGDATADFLEWIQQRRREIPGEYENLLRAAGMALPPAGSRARDIARHPQPDRPTSVQDSGPTSEQLSAIEAYYDNVRELERSTAADRTDAIRDHGRRRADMVEDFEKNLTRTAANYAKQRARAVEEYEKGVARLQRDYQAQALRMAEDHERNLARMRADHSRHLADLQEDLDTRNSERRAESAERLADFAEDRDEGIVEAREKSAGRLLDIEEDYSRNRVRAVRAHEDAISEAASRLDARAVYNEQRRFAREQEEAAEAHQEKVDDEQEKLDEAIKNLNDAYAEKVADEQEALQKSIDQAQKAYDKQVSDANEAFAQREQDAIDSYKQQAADSQQQHEQRLSDMATDFNEEMRQRDGDQADRIAEMKTDHQENLTELDTEHGERLLQIERHAGLEREKLDEEFEKELGALGDHNFDTESEQFKHQQRALKMYQDYLDDREREEINANIRSLKRQRDTGDLTPAEITALNNSISALQILLGRIGVDPGRHVDPRTAPVQINPDEQILTTGFSGASFITPAGKTTAAAVGGMAVTIASGAIVINAAPGMSTAGMGDDFERKLLTVLQRVARNG